MLHSVVWTKCQEQISFACMSEFENSVCIRCMPSTRVRRTQPLAKEFPWTVIWTKWVRQSVKQSKQQEAAQELERVRRISRTNWLMVNERMYIGLLIVLCRGKIRPWTWKSLQVINLPLPFGVSEGQVLQLLFTKLGYAKPLFDSDRDLLAADSQYVNRSGQLCHLSVRY